MQKRRYYLKSGISIVELIVYCAIFGLMLVIVTNGIIRLGQVYGLARNERKVANVASIALERIVRELALACEVTGVAANSIKFIAYENFNPAVNSVAPDFKTCKDGAGGRVEKTIERVLNGADADRIKLGTQFLSPLASEVKVTQLAFQKLAGNAYDEFQAVRTTINATAGSGNYEASRTYYATTILRNSY